jgi:hypothetical protein
MIGAFCQLCQYCLRILKVKLKSTSLSLCIYVRAWRRANVSTQLTELSTKLTASDRGRDYGEAHRNTGHEVQR